MALVTVTSHIGAHAHAHARARTQKHTHTHTETHTCTHTHTHTDTHMYAHTHIYAHTHTDTLSLTLMVQKVTGLVDTAMALKLQKLLWNTSKCHKNWRKGNRGTHVMTVIDLHLF